METYGPFPKKCRRTEGATEWAAPRSYDISINPLVPSPVGKRNKIQFRNKLAGFGLYQAAVIIKKDQPRDLF